MNTSSIEQKECFGCGACAQSCPTNAITMVLSSEGFYVPQIDQEKCTNCGLCIKSCPVFSSEFYNFEKPLCYAFKGNKKVQEKSTSGGAFYILAKHFITQGGYVAGAIWNDDYSTVKHVLSNNIEDIEKMRKSKYLQSDINNCYKETKDKLIQNYKVLFAGTPCQIAGLKAYLKKEYENLYTIDLICHGVPSPLAYQKYIQEFLTQENEKILSVDFRKKINKKEKTVIETTHKTISEEYNSNKYMRTFLDNINIKSSCLSCKFQTFPRQGDLTIGDFWGVKKYNIFYYDKKGVSLILLNNNKSEYLLNILKENNSFIKKVPLKYAIKGNPCLTKPAHFNKLRDIFFKFIEKNTYTNSLNLAKEENKKCDYLIVNFWDSKFNYGAMLTAFAIQEVLKSFGFKTKLLNTGERTNQYWFYKSHMEDFVRKYLDVTDELSFKDCKEFSKNIKGMFLGSDQVLRPDYMGNFTNKFMFSFAPKEVKKIAFSPSFGLLEEEYAAKFISDTSKIEYMKKALKSFDYLSTREFEGQKIYKNIFGLNSDMIIDPVFLLDKQYYIDLAKKSKKDIKNKIVTYVLDSNKEYQKAYEQIQEKTQISLYETNRKDSDFTTEDWLNAIINSELVISDSFHCICFAIIFNKPFVCIKNKNRGSSRLDTLCSLFNIQERIVCTPTEVLNIENILNVDYSQINKTIKNEKDRCLSILKDITNNNYSNNPDKEDFNEFFQFSKKQKKKTKKKYIINKILSKVTFGKLRRRYKGKYFQYKKELEWN